MNATWKTCLLAVLLAPLSLAADWPPIPPEIWAMKEDPAKGIWGAVILEDRTILRSGYLERIYRARILSEAGRKAAELRAFSDDCNDIKGRTVTPDGKILTFDNRRDFKSETQEIGDYSIKRTFVVPPGVTGNCVVEVHWKESTPEGHWSPLPARFGYDGIFRFGSEYVTLLETKEVPLKFPWSYQAIPGRTQKLDAEEKSGFRIYTARDHAALEQPPFSLSVSLDRPTFSVFLQPQSLTEKAWKALEDQKGYWDAVGREIWKKFFEEDIKKGKHFEAFRIRIMQGIAAKGPWAVANELLTAVEKEIVNVAHLTREETARWPKDQQLPAVKDLAGTCKVKAADAQGMVVLFYHLLKDIGMKPRIALLVDRDERLFRQGMLNPWQATHAVVVVEEPGKGMLFLDPQQRFAAPGLLLPNFQGVQCLLLNPADNWSAQPFEVPIQPAVFNQSRLEYSLVVGEEEDRFNVKAQFSGFPELIERRRYDRDEQPERDRKLQERFEKGLKGVSIQRAQIQNAANPSANVAWLVEGQFEREPSRQRHVEPFPGLSYPIRIPDFMPKERTLAIVMPYLQIQTARSTFKVPKGYCLNSGPTFQQKNRFGTVHWSAQVQPQGDELIVVVTLKVSVDTMFAPPTAYEDLKNFLGWITEVHKRTILLEKM